MFSIYSGHFHIFLWKIKKKKLKVMEPRQYGYRLKASNLQMEYKVTQNLFGDPEASKPSDAN